VPAAETPSPFRKSLQAAAVRAPRESIDDIDTALVRQVAVLQVAGRLLQVDYQHVHETENGGWLKLAFFAEGLYQQLHATVTTAAVLVGQRGSPPVEATGLASLQEALARQPEHDLNAALHRIRREVRLLRWLGTVRNKALQHRAETGYLGGRGIVLREAYALLHHPVGPDAQSIRKAKALFIGMSRRYGAWLTDAVDGREMVTYLDLASHELFAPAPNDFDTCRRLVEAAKAHDLVVSAPLLENADTALSALIETAPSTRDCGGES
jgi:hypothetical protein